eukprot:COSAG06_NODE_4479_length_4213_cov_1507.910306_1_plen_59_part_10
MVGADEKVTAHSSIRVAACDKRGGGTAVLCKLAVICLDPSGLCLTTGVPVGSMFNDGPT